MSMLPWKFPLPPRLWRRSPEAIRAVRGARPADTPDAEVPDPEEIAATYEQTVTRQRALLREYQVARGDRDADPAPEAEAEQPAQAPS